jgi:hypothetical protein
MDDDPIMGPSKPPEHPGWRCLGFAIMAASAVLTGLILGWAGLCVWRLAMTFWRKQ